MLLQSGLVDAFSENKQFKINSFCNDTDQDTCGSNWLLVNHKLVTALETNQRLEEWLRFTDRSDTTSGYFRVNPDSLVMRQMAWVNEPYVEARMAGRIPSMTGKEMAQINVSVGERITAYIENRAEERELKSGYDVIGAEDGWKMIVENGYYARAMLANDRVNAFVSYRGKDEKGHHYTLGRLNTAIRFPIPDLYKFLNSAENRDSKFGEWGGGDTTGGSSRGERASQFDPQKLRDLIRLFLSREAQFH